MNRLVVLTLILTAVFIFGCQSKSRDANEVMQEVQMDQPVRGRAMKFAAPQAVDRMMVKSEEETSQTATIAQPEISRKIIREGRVSVRTNDIAAGKKNIDQLAAKFNGWYDNEEMQNDDRIISYELKIRVPVENFEKLLAAIENGTDELVSKSIHSRDVTAEFVDIEARISSKKEYLKRYLELLAKANTVKDILEIQENIRNIQEEIESREKQLKYLSGQVSYSTLDVNLFKNKDYTYKPAPQDNFFERIKNAISKGWTSLVGCLLFLVQLWPYIVLLLSAWFLLKRFKKNKKSQ